MIASSFTLISTAASCAVVARACTAVENPRMCKHVTSYERIHRSYDLSLPLFVQADVPFLPFHAAIINASPRQLSIARGASVRKTQNHPTVVSRFQFHGIGEHTRRRSQPPVGCGQIELPRRHPVNRSPSHDWHTKLTQGAFLPPPLLQLPQSG